MMSITDWRERIIPDVFLFPFLLTGTILVAFDALPWIMGGITDSAIAAVTGYSLAFVLNILFKIKAKTESKSHRNPSHALRLAPHVHDPIGMGDIKLLAAGGLWLGVTGLSIALVAACATGWIWGRCKGQKFVPFAPFFFTGAVLSIIVMMVWRI
ncbi:MAG: A24 family peptidase [Alphaproteobacteria bacterium]|nr:A24 family peptidase [Alphaproteobacteria bacterium]